MSNALVNDLFEQFMGSAFAVEVPRETRHLLKLAFFSGAKCVVALAGEALQPAVPGGPHNVKSMCLQLAKLDHETTMFIRNPDPPEPEEDRMVTLN